ncbi:TetR/AcrR family transcriptional regulator [Pseudoalteromonas shioyasakiensis]|uniref:TetR/AcrR family transcriptional regulator n=1 Tax=Pseudoalteromonas shioyasakiensis TaxID=1190813 RepID=UPI00211928DD|nr:TetR/AcrR family transcriptional regulator [Pseudoalteromonas shioyasakiensis]MCQ8876881.1 TetR/AcrR family transcriptional regulator [Pseudoalteromonas shioyasakiensis]
MRVAEFDREYVLRQAMIAFTQYGYAKTSMQKLTQVTALHPGSLYAAFKNKKGIFLAAIEQYQADRNQQFTNLFCADKAVLPNLKAYIDSVVAECVSGDSMKVCLLTKSISEVEGQDEQISQVLSDNLNAYENTLAEQFNRAILKNEITTEYTAKQRARFLAMGLYGLRTYALTNNKRDDLKQLADDLYIAITK